MAERETDLMAHATLADLVALLERKRAAARAIADNDAADADARAQARDWCAALDVLLAMMNASGFRFTPTEAHQLILHWNRLFKVLAGELRAGLHVGGAG